MLMLILKNVKKLIMIVNISRKDFVIHFKTVKEIATSIRKNIKVCFIDKLKSNSNTHLSFMYKKT